jgi:hypothetical protein
MLSMSEQSVICVACGCRTVPIELGTSYLSQNSSQRLMTVAEFIDSHVLPFQYMEARSSTASSVKIPDSNDQADNALVVGYLAQHQFFKQVPCLRGDFSVPDYCACLLDVDEEFEQYDDNSHTVGEHDAPKSSCVGFQSQSAESIPPASIEIIDYGAGDQLPDADRDKHISDEEEDVMIQLWFGSAYTMSPLHHDPFHNLLAQVCGYKYVRLYPSNQSHLLYPRPGTFYNNRYEMNSSPWTVPVWADTILLVVRWILVIMTKNSSLWC